VPLPLQGPLASPPPPPKRPDPLHPESLSPSLSPSGALPHSLPRSPYAPPRARMPQTCRLMDSANDRDRRGFSANDEERRGVENDAERCGSTSAALDVGDEISSPTFRSSSGIASGGHQAPPRSRSPVGAPPACARMHRICTRTHMHRIAHWALMPRPLMRGARCSACAVCARWSGERSRSLRSTCIAADTRAAPSPAPQTPRGGGGQGVATPAECAAASSTARAAMCIAVRCGWTTKGQCSGLNVFSSWIGP